MSLNMLRKNYFNPHSREGSDDNCTIDKDFKKLFQSTLPRREWRERSNGKSYAVKISIHTPAKGVTNRKREYSNSRDISIHTPAKGVTCFVCWFFFTDNNFNPHSREGSDVLRYKRPPYQRYFNPHSREGSDRLPNVSDNGYISISIHTPAKGVTYSPLHHPNLWQNFNPHSREGSDL